LTTRVLVDVRDAAVALGGRTIWSDISATVHSGEFVAILGPNGVGKSSLLKAILGLIPLASGSVKPLHHREVGYLPQSAQLRRVTADPGRRRGAPRRRRRRGGACRCRASAPGPPRRASPSWSSSSAPAPYAHRPIGQLSAASSSGC